ncbi:glycerophosphoryl diester phosphodiesterase [Trichoderma cornu-damae]|uniref:Glycerophosphoryl diester phosphodiesterase n=1 Tax=Trichoderma cornu-damae TaxID=654480 RepID=A0A9P8TTN1_9HYPO|nr:glycerophosphoryl diester phosphodiesterase [Trichoderma cornu-damae]
MSPLHRGITVPKAAKWASAIASRSDASRRIPQAIAHRGFRASFPENSMAAFRGAVEAGAHAIETDVHLSKDGVVVLSHDPSLRRCFGVNLLIKDCTWSYLSSLRTVEEPHEPLARLGDLLEYLVSGPETEKIWALLDTDDKPEDLLFAMAGTLKEVSSVTPWDERIILGCWNASFIKAAISCLPGFPLAHISYSPLYSRHFLPIPNLSVNMFYILLVGPLCKWLLGDANKAGRPFFVWVVNDDKWMEWFIRKNIPRNPSPLLASSSSGASSASSPSDGKVQDDVMAPAASIDGVITDDPKLFLQVCRRVEDELDGKTATVRRQSLGAVLGTLRRHLGTTLWILLANVLTMSSFLYKRFQGKMDKLDNGFFDNFQP